MKNRKIKVLHIITHLHVGGAQDNTLLTLEQHDRKKFDVTLMCAPEGDWVSRAQNIPELKIVFIDKLTRPIHLFSDVIAFFKILRHLRKVEYDIVHTHSSKPGFLGRIAAKMAKVPLVIHTIHGFPFHDFMPKIPRLFFIFLEKQCARLSDRIITVSRLNLEKAVELGIAPKDKFTNIYSGIDFCKFKATGDRDSKRQELGIPADHLIVGMIGRLSKQKSPWNLIDAAPLVLEKFPNTCFISVGSGELFDNMKARVHKHNLEKHFMFLGWRQDIADLLQLFDVYTLPSQWEGLGRSLTEAMYLKKAVVASAVEGVPEIVENGETGLLVPANNPRLLAEGICRLLADENLRRKMGEKAFQKVCEIFKVEKMVADIERLYVVSLQESLRRQVHTQKTNAANSRQEKTYISQKDEVVSS